MHALFRAETRHAHKMRMQNYIFFANPPSFFLIFDSNLTKKDKITGNVIVVCQRFTKLEARYNANFCLTEKAPSLYFEEVCLTQSFTPLKPFFFLKNHDKNLSTFPFNLEKKYVKNLYFPTPISSLLVGKFVSCGF